MTLVASQSNHFYINAVLTDLASVLSEIVCVDYDYDDDNEDNEDNLIKIKIMIQIFLYHIMANQEQPIDKIKELCIQLTSIIYMLQYTSHELHYNQEYNYATLINNIKIDLLSSIKS